METTNSRKANYRIELLGASGAGKTVLLMQLFVNLHYRRDAESQGRFRILPSAGMAERVRAASTRINSNDKFPLGTSSDSERFEFTIDRADPPLRCEVLVEDRPGRRYSGLQWDEQKRQAEDGALIANLRAADGHILLLDVGNPQDADAWLAAFLVSLYGDDDSNVRRPIAVCLTKSDCYVRNIEDVESLRACSGRFAHSVIRRDYGKFLQRLEDFQIKSEFFPVSATGVRAPWGVLLPTVIYDEHLEPRPLLKDLETLNLVEPFAWIMSQLEH